MTIFDKHETKFTIQKYLLFLTLILSFFYTLFELKRHAGDALPINLRIESDSLNLSPEVKVYFTTYTNKILGPGSVQRKNGNEWLLNNYFVKSIVVGVPDRLNTIHASLTIGDKEFTLDEKEIKRNPLKSVVDSSGGRLSFFILPASMHTGASLIPAINRNIINWPGDLKIFTKIFVLLVLFLFIFGVIHFFEKDRQKHFKRALIAFACGTAVLNLFIIYNHGLEPRFDYRANNFFAKAAAEGINPYSVQQSQRTVMGPERIENYTPDYPPFNIYFNYLVYSNLGATGLFNIYALLFTLCIALYILWVFKNGAQGNMGNPFLVISFLGILPIFREFWFYVPADKVIFLFFILVSLLSYRNKVLFAIVTALYSSLKGVGIFIFLFYIVHFFINKEKRKGILLTVAVFVLVIVLCHLPYFPEGLNGYKYRSMRQNFVTHQSIFCIPVYLGIYFKGMSEILTLAGFTVLFFQVLRKRLSMTAIIILATVISISFNTEPSINRILLVLLVLSLSLNNSAGWLIYILFSVAFPYAINITDFEVYPSKFYCCLAVWIWVTMAAILYLKSLKKEIPQTEYFS